MARDDLGYDDQSGDFTNVPGYRRHPLLRKKINRKISSASDSIQGFFSAAGAALAWPFIKLWALICLMFRIILSPFRVLACLFSFRWLRPLRTVIVYLLAIICVVFKKPVQWLLFPVFKWWEIEKDAWDDRDWFMMIVWLFPGLLLFGVYRLVLSAFLSPIIAFVLAVLLWLWEFVCAVVIWLWEFSAELCLWSWACISSLFN